MNSHIGNFCTGIILMVHLPIDNVKRTKISRLIVYNISAVRFEHKHPSAVKLVVFVYIVITINVILVAPAKRIIRGEINCYYSVQIAFLIAEVYVARNGCPIITPGSLLENEFTCTTSAELSFYSHRQIAVNKFVFEKASQHKLFRLHGFAVIIRTIMPIGSFFVCFNCRAVVHECLTHLRSILKSYFIYINSVKYKSSYHIIILSEPKREAATKSGLSRFAIEIKNCNLPSSFLVFRVLSQTCLQVPLQLHPNRHHL